MSDKVNPASSEEKLAWGKARLSAAIDELSNKGIIDTPLVEARIAWMLPGKFFIAELRESSTSPPALWLIGGDDIPCDHVDVVLADTPRDAARHFGMKWQLAISREGQNPVLEASAELLLGLVQVDDAWT
jgi:hypothetical protein